MADRIDRREALRRMSAAGGGIALSPLAMARGAEAAPRRRPNIVFILIDDLCSTGLSCMGHPFLQTPNIDRIANEGVKFENAFVTISLCSPSRACFLTGTYAHVHNVRTNEANDYDPRLRSFPQILQGHGYETGYVGKWHMEPKADPRPGFDYWLSFGGQGQHIDPELNENGTDFKAEGYMTDILTDYATRWLDRDRERPFCLYLSHKAIHGPFTPAERHKDAFAGVEIPEPPSFRDTFKGKPEWIRAGFVRGARREQWLANRDKPIPAELEPGVWDPKAENRLNYYRMMLSVDESVGQVLSTLEKLGVLDETVVMFTSDNGYFQGEHRRGDKRLMYEESIRIPLLVRFPGVAQVGATPDEMVLNIDVAPTLLDLAGVEPPDVMQGMSFRPLLESRRVDWRESWLYEYFQEGWLPGIPTMFGVRTNRWKYITYPDIEDIDELYDLRRDRYEMTNLAEDPEHADQLAEMRDELQHLLEETNYAPAPKPKPRKVPVKLLASYTLDEGEGETAGDDTGNGNDGAIEGATWDEGISGKALRFSGAGSVAIAKSDGIDPALKPWTVEAWVKPESGNGVVVAHGGQSHGYALYLQGGCPTFAARVSGDICAVAGPEKVGGDWTHLAGVLTPASELILYVNGEPVATAESSGFIGQNPNEGLEIGTDEGSKVADYTGQTGFVGLIDEVRIYQGARRPEAIKRSWSRFRGS
jgi:N-acetylglucosamine-6-sulfatase